MTLEQLERMSAGKKRKRGALVVQDRYQLLRRPGVAVYPLAEKLGEAGIVTVLAEW